jgi:hypothetical protein
MNDNSPNDNLLIVLREEETDQSSPNCDIIPFSGSATTLQSRGKPLNSVCKISP